MTARSCVQVMGYAEVKRFRKSKGGREALAEVSPASPTWRCWRRTNDKVGSLKMFSKGSELMMALWSTFAGLRTQCNDGSGGFHSPLDLDDDDDDD
eukprot:1466646-Amphidinium_carterae.1